MSSETQYNMSSDDVTISVRPVVHYTRHPECPKCGHSLGIFAWWLSATGSCAQNFGYCKGDVDSTISINLPIQQMFGGAEAKIPTVCFGNVEEHIHIKCARCQYLWLMAVKPPKKSRKGLPPWRLLMFMLGVLFTLLVTSLAHCEEAPTENAVTLPEAPKPQPATRYDYSVWAGIAGEHWLDYRLTEVCTSPGHYCRENILPGFVWKHKAMFIATEASFSVAQVGISKELRKRHHRTEARIWDMANLVAFGIVDGYVYALDQKKAPATATTFRRKQ